jgi:hypothetical protein
MDDARAWSSALGTRDGRAASLLNPPPHLLQLASNRASPKRVPEDDADEKRGRNVDDVLKGHGKTR